MIERFGKHRLSLAAVVLAGLTAAILPAHASTDVRAGADAQATLDSKTRLVKQLLAQPVATQRIPQSGNAQAKKKLADAQASYAKASSEAAAGRSDAAIKLLDVALKDIGEASRLVPDAMQLASQERARYASLVESTKTFLALHKSASARMAGKNGSAGALDVNRINGMLEKAESLAAGGNHKDANGILNDAYKSTVAAINKMLMSETIVYDLKFDSPADEFRHELARNRSYEELVPLAIAQLNPNRESAAMSERYVQQSKELRNAAQKQAATGDYQTALKTIQDATGHLQRSLRAAGVVVPQSTESKP